MSTALGTTPNAPGGTGPIGDIAQRLDFARFSPTAMLAVLTDHLACPVGLVDAEGRTLAGDVAATARQRLASVQHPDRPARRVVALPGDSLLVIHPVQPVAGRPANLWLVAEVPFEPAARVREVGEVLALGAWAFVTYVSSVAVRLERDDTHSEALLARLVEEADAPGRTVVEQAAALGWRLGGTHYGINIRCRGRHGQREVLAHRLRAALSDQGVGAEPIVDGPGWSLWADADGDRFGGEDGVSALQLSVRRALLAAERGYPGARLSAGIGTRDAGTVGLRRSLLEARDACQLAGARDVVGAVEYLGSGNVKRLLSGRHTTSLQLGLARQLLVPLTVADPTGQLVRTLCAYLDHESSATATAAGLGVHRNTVLQRLDRIRTLLTVGLDTPDGRLALHLAVRLVQSHGRPVAG
jgi:sugar diacid utilization regulator